MRNSRRFAMIGTVFAAAMSATALTPLTAYAADAVLSGSITTSAGEKLGGKVSHVFVPSAVNPTTGFLLVVPEEKLRYLQMTPEQAMKMIVSAGAIVPPKPNPSGP